MARTAVHLRSPGPDDASKAVRSCGERSLELLRLAADEELSRLEGAEAFRRLTAMMPTPSAATLLLDQTEPRLHFCLPGEPGVYVAVDALTPRFARMLIVEDVIFHVV